MKPHNDQPPAAVAPIRRSDLRAGTSQAGLHPKLPVRAAALPVVGLLFSALACASAPSGHIKFAASSTDLPSDSVYAEDSLNEAGVDIRLSANDQPGDWHWQVDYQLQYLDGDRLSSTRPAGDDARLFDLTDRFSESDTSLGQQRIDRLLLAYRGRDTVVSVGRQAISWGNGVIFNPVDLFNPFDPTALDTEYKPGDDMIYAQRLFAGGNDLQAVWVVRRDAEQRATAEVASLAVKYHAYGSSGEYELLAARHFDSTVLAIGGGIDFAEGLWRGDLVLTDTDAGKPVSAVINWSRTTTVAGRNLSATIEYFRNGFGIDDGDYLPSRLAGEPELTSRLERGDLFSLGRDYLAAAATVEIDPRWLLSATLIANLNDASRRLQLVNRYDPHPAMLLTVAIDLPTGDRDSEYAGPPSSVPGRSLGTDARLFAQLAWYF